MTSPSAPLRQSRRQTQLPVRFLDEAIELPMGRPGHSDEHLDLKTSFTSTSDAAGFPSSSPTNVTHQRIGRATKTAPEHATTDVPENMPPKKNLISSGANVATLSTPCVGGILQEQRPKGQPRGRGTKARKPAKTFDSASAAPRPTLAQRKAAKAAKSNKNAAGVSGEPIRNVQYLHRAYESAQRRHEATAAYHKQRNKIIMVSWLHIPVVHVHL